MIIYWRYWFCCQTSLAGVKLEMVLGTVCIISSALFSQLKLDQEPGEQM